tara:strand:+ start:127 stop:363 length:237 start_codon:yes stop_codon:yes gene_type:complete
MTGLIRKIIIGKDPKNAMAYYLGMKAGSGNVCAIVLDETKQHVHGKTRYLVYLENEDGQVLWKAVDEMPCIVEFDCNF